MQFCRCMCKNAFQKSTHETLERDMLLLCSLQPLYNEAFKSEWCLCQKIEDGLEIQPKISITICFCIAYSTYICISDRAGPRSGPRPVFIWKAQSPTFEEWPKPGEAWAQLLGKGLKFWVFHVVNLKPGVHGWAQARARFLEPDPSVKCIYILERDICITYILSWIIWGERTRFNQQRIKAGL